MSPPTVIASMPSEEEGIMSEPKTRTLGAVLYEGFELLDLYGPLEMFGSIGAGLKIVTVAEQNRTHRVVSTAEDGRRVRLRERAEAGSHASAGWLGHNPAARESRNPRFLAPESGDGRGDDVGLLRIGDSGEGGAARRTAGDVEQAVLRSR